MTTRIVLCGGPAAGKTAVLKRLRRLPRGTGVHVVLIDETASAFLEDCPDAVAQSWSVPVRQYAIYRAQRALERLAEQTCAEWGGDSVIITDRGLPDLFVYLEEDEARAMLSPGEEEAMRYDYTLFLEDAGREHFETAGRVERDYAEAQALSARTRVVWERFSEGRMLVIPPAPQVEDKVLDVARLINTLTGKTVFLAERAALV